MAEWVRFHRELCLPAKRSIPRAMRFLYMEISLEAKRKRGYVVLRPDVDIVSAVHDCVSGDRREVAQAVKLFMAGDPAMWTEETVGNERRLYVNGWAKWNPADSTGSERQARLRNVRRNGESNGASNGDGNGVDRDGHDDVTDTSAPARADLLSSSSLSLSSPSQLSSDLHEGPRPTGLDRNMTGDGAAGMAVTAWCDGIRQVTKGVVVRPKGQQLAQLNEAIRTGSALAGQDAVAWAEESARAFATDGGPMNVFRYLEFIAGRPAIRKAPSRAQAAPGTDEGPVVDPETAKAHFDRLQAVLAPAGRLPGGGGGR